MSIFKATPKNYATIVAPLTKIESDLSTYMGINEIASALLKARSMRSKQRLEMPT